MEERTHTTPSVAPGDRDAPEPSAVAQVPLPFEPLPFDDEAERPIPFALTARARRTVAPQALPPLRVLPGSGTAPPSPGGAAGPGADAATADLDDDPSDTRPARARALRRSGVPTANIAAQLGVDELLVRAWTASVVPTRRTRDDAARPASTRRASAEPPSPLHAGGRDADAEAARTAFELARSAAEVVARTRLAGDPALAAGLGVLAGTADISATAVDITTSDPRIAGAAVRWLTEVLGAHLDEVRLVLRVGPRAAADLARHRWARAVGIAPDRIRTTRAVATVRDDGVEGLLRVVDADLAAAAAGWRDALLDPGPADDGF